MMGCSGWISAFTYETGGAPSLYEMVFFLIKTVREEIQRSVYGTSGCEGFGSWLRGSVLLGPGSRNQEEEPQAEQRCLPHNGQQPAEIGREGIRHTSRAPEYGSRDPPPTMFQLLKFLNLPNNVIKF